MTNSRLPVQTSSDYLNYMQVRSVTLSQEVVVRWCTFRALCRSISSILNLSFNQFYKMKCQCKSTHFLLIKAEYFCLFLLHLLKLGTIHTVIGWTQFKVVYTFETPPKINDFWWICSICSVRICLSMVLWIWFVEINPTCQFKESCYIFYNRVKFNFQLHFVIPFDNAFWVYQCDRDDELMPEDLWIQWTICEYYLLNWFQWIHEELQNSIKMYV